MKHQTTDLLASMSLEEKNNIVSRITYLRHDLLNMTQQQFADIIQISQTYLSLLENGRKEINETTILQIVLRFKVNLDWLCYGIGDSVFQTEKEISATVTQTIQSDALKNLQSAFSLKENDLELIQKYLSLSEKEKTNIKSALNTLIKLL